jgi:hypothetical protein
MPADADILCEYYLSKNFKTVTASKSSPNSSSSQLVATKKSSLVDNKHTSTESAILLESIDFVKYDKNPMDFLKSKYQLLNTTATANAASTSSQTIVQNPNATKPKLVLNGTSPATSNGDVAKVSTNGSAMDLSWNKIKKTGIGLYNLGNNCYLNATLQCLAYTPPLSQWLVAKPHSPACKLF